MERARELRGAVGPISEMTPRPDRSAHWHYGFEMARDDVLSVLVPEGVDREDYVASHEPDEADAQAVEALIERRSTGSLIARGLHGDAEGET